MASCIPGNVLSNLTAENDLSALQYHILEAGGTVGQADVCDGATDKPIGVLQNKPTAGQAVSYMVDGTTKLVAGGAITAGDEVGTKNDGRGVTKTADADWVIGRARTSSTTNGDIIEVELRIQQRAS